MSPEQFVARLQSKGPAGVYLFVGPESYQRNLCRTALLEGAIPEGNREDALTRVDLESTQLAAALDDARSMSLFAAQRVIWIAGAESALPRVMRAGSEKDESSGQALVADYVRRPTPGTVVVFDCNRYEFEGDDKPKIERVMKFYAAIPDIVEFRPYTPDAARRLAQDLARSSGLQIGNMELGLLVESLAYDGGRIAAEVEKLSLYAGRERKVTVDDIARLVPNAQASNLFALAGALGRGDRKRSLDSLDTLLREGEYLPLALTFLATQLRLALVAQEAGARTASQIQAQCTRLGIRMWRDRAEQVAQTVSAFSQERLQDALEKIYWADKALRDTRPDDRVVLEQLVFSLTKN